MRRAPPIPSACAFGVGSLPDVDPEVALDRVARHTPALPFWPQLPRRARNEDMLGQALGAALDVLPPRSGWPVEVPDPEALIAALRPELRPSEAAGFFAFERAVEAGRFPQAQALKAQLVGPWTFHASLGLPDAPLPDALLPALAEHLAALAAWQVRRLSRFGLPVLLVLDEPSLASASAEGWPRALAALRRVLRELDETGGVVGLHCCADLDPERIEALSPALYSFDAYQGLEAFWAHPAAQRWRAGGGLTALGVVPATGPLPTREALEARLKATLGEDREGLLWATSCGLAGASVERAEAGLALAAGLGR